MTAGRDARASAGEVAEALGDVAALDGFFVLRTGVAEDGPTAPGRGGRLTAECFTGLARQVTDRYATDEARIGVSIAHLGLAARLWSPVLACTLIHGIVPDLSTLEWIDGGPAVRLAHPAGRRVAQVPRLADAVYEEVIAALAAVESDLGVKVAPRLLDGNIASALVGSAAVLLRARPDLRTALTALTTELLGRGRLVGTGRITGPALTFRRRSCCLYYRTPGGGKCGDCCLND
ncbi:(2Fe-2S)-binding protein [Streptomyces sp. SID14478]|uniref:(2Fe-2S)-binding protein n=1 Tax=Streptomyces sp. SID14478 TaxID=2706073 RepID=UPI0013DD3A03|nr:(2Fe-2S)-binding protein [Streptomyces sp. SID14478]NEB73760.1 (2Fe-2S)-binding protein [Streptomyces sp. SID14478]